MAIEKMKKLRLMAVRSQKEELLRELMILGCVQITEPEEEMADPAISAVVKRESSELMRYRAQFASLTHAVELLGKYAPKKSGLLAARPLVEQDDFLSDAGLEKVQELAAEIEAGDDRIKRINAEQSRERGVIESLLPWQELDLPLECTGTEKAAVTVGMLPAAVNFAEAAAAIAAVTEEAELSLVFSDKDQQYVVLICFRDDYSAVQDVLRQYAFTVAAIAGLEGTARQNIEKSNAIVESLEEEKQAIAAKIIGFGEMRDDLKLCADRLSTKIGSAEAEDRLYGLDAAIILEGWVPEANLAGVEALLDKYACAYESEDPAPEEYPDVPVKLRNNKFTNSLNMVTNMYSLPAYDGVDPNPLMAPFFILFYGLMLSDMGYGLIMMIAGLVVMKKMRPRAGMLSFAQLMFYCGISTFIVGACTGGFFADAPYQVVHMLNPASTWQGLPALFSPLNDSLYVLIGAMVLGIIQLNTGLVISFVKKLRRGEVLDAIFYEVSLWVILAGIILTVLGVMDMANTKMIGFVVLGVGLVALFYGGTRGKKGFGKVTSIFGTLYNEATGWFGDILSYSRIMALMLAGCVIGQVFNTIGAITGNIFLFLIIFLVGHALNFALNLLGCYVHDLRLQCLEYFGKFYEDGGKPFKPLDINTKYYDIAK